MSYKVIQRAITCTITLRNKYMLQRETGNKKKKKKNKGFQMGDLEAP